jgi:NADH-quinone oxidoreductase subunit L
MRVALLPLAFGALTTWLLAGPFSQLLAQSLPFHEIEGEGLVEMIAAVLGAPATYLALGVIALGLAAWFWRQPLAGVGRALSGLGRLATNGFGFEDINRGIVKGTFKAADLIRPLQTGLLNWNVVGIVGGLLVVIVWLAWGVGGR